MRGEETVGACELRWCEELPPHARRREGSYGALRLRPGITSACAEKSFVVYPRLIAGRNYLRMRGEETALPAETLAVGVVL